MPPLNNLLKGKRAVTATKQCQIDQKQALVSLWKATRKIWRCRFGANQVAYKLFQELAVRWNEGIFKFRRKGIPCSGYLNGFRPELNESKTPPPARSRRRLDLSFFDDILAIPENPEWTAEEVKKIIYPVMHQVLIARVWNGFTVYTRILVSDLRSPPLALESCESMSRSETW